MRRIALRRGAVAILASVACAVTAASAHAESARSQTVRQLDLQYELAADVPFANIPWIYTHNSFNSFAELGVTGVSANDPNQLLSIVGQLNEGVRSLEIDTHLFPNPADPRVDGQGPVVCHATNNHGACKAVKSLKTVLLEVRGWLRAHPHQVIFLYLESHLDTAAGYAAGASELREALGDKLYRPPGGGSRCAPLPLRLTRNQIRAAGKQVLAMGPCGVGNRWQGLVHSEQRRITAESNAKLRPFPGCGPDFTRTQYDAQPVRYYEDRTKVGAVTKTTHGPIDRALAGRMTGCGVDLVGFDMLRFGDPRLRAMVWSWAPGQPRRTGGDCAAQRPSGRWTVAACATRRRVACATARGGWRVPAQRVRASAAIGLCARRGLVHATPRTGYEGQLLKVAAARARARSVWIAERRSGTGWRALDRPR